MSKGWLGVLTLVAMPAFGDAGSGAEVGFPCPDGWTACEVDGERIEPVGRTDSSGRPLLADARVGWFDLEATTTFSPFQRVTEHAAPVRPEPAPVRPVPPPKQPAIVTPVAPVEVVVPAPVVAEEPVEPVLSDVAPAEEPVPPVPEQPVVVDATDAVETPADPVDGEKSGNDDDGTTSIDDDGVAKIGVPETPCPPLVDLEPHALLGALSPEELRCAERALAEADRQTARDKASRLLITNAYGAGDTAGWAALLKNHLETIDQSDPALVYRYALHQQRAGHPAEAIRWSEVALENRTIWTGSAYVRNVNGLYKLRAAAGQDRWKEATARYEASPTAEASEEADALRARAKVYAREWLEYARQAGLDTTVATDLCVSTAGTTTYCDAP
jgi:hypothetical protein